MNKELRSPNAEQRLAIEHSGGVLLAAGAGSGKTFVLVEHIIYLVNQFLNEKEQHSIEELETELKIYLSKIVLMTFTNKAAGELSIRLKDRVDDELTLNQSVHPMFYLAKSAIDSMTVGTIHGFCFKLLNQGFFPNIAKGVSIIDEIESKHRIEALCRRWFLELEEDQAVDNLVKDIFFKHYGQVIISLCGIFGSPDLRIHWNVLDIDAALDFDLENLFLNIISEKGISNPLLNSFNLNVVAEHKSKKWYQFIESFEKEKNSLDFSKFESMKEMTEMLSSLKSVRAPSKIDFVDEIKDYLSNLRLLKKELPDLIENIEMYYQYRDTLCKSQISCFKSAFDYINKYYFEESGLTFSDLEYLVLSGLQNSEIVDRISESYQYFIIDEFQDTSEVQFKMISNLIKGDFKKVFCVGDMKQAIYGFRGGELGVFKACMDYVNTNLSMTNNYRSAKNIIEFNNHLFGEIFPKGYKFKGIEENSVPVEFQTCPNSPDSSEDEKGRLYKHGIRLLDEDSPLNSTKTSQIDYAEAKQIHNQVVSLKQNHEGNICILYKKLSPSNYLIAELIKNNIAFTAQIKIPAKEDFNLGLFYLFLNILSGIQNPESQEFNANKKVIIAYLETLGVKVIGDLENHIIKFVKNYKIIGLVDAFQKFLFEMNLSNSNFENNLLTIQKIINLTHEDIENSKLLFEESFENRYSIDFRFGENSSEIIIMTAHSSKGLEFDHVILGGIHTNARKRVDDSFLGKNPGSFKWKSHSSQKKPFQTPQLLLEKSLAKKKEFQESKRLFYVACTRAVSTLSWVDLRGSKSELSFGGESWIDGIRAFEESFSGPSKEILTVINDNVTNRDVDWNHTEEEINSFNNKPPMFHIDELGNYIKSSTDQSEQSDDNNAGLGTLCELSVTRLANLAECPRKFYLANILKLEGDEIVVTGNNQANQENVKHSEELSVNTYSEELIDKNIIKSSAGRGTQIHQAIEFAIKNNFQVPDYVEARKDIDAVKYVTSLLTEYNDQTSLISEKPLKFPFFNYMISGTPDLVILDGHGTIEVWDYKTGSFKVENPAYKMQLMTYAFAYVQLGHCLPTDKIKLKLVYVDQKESILFDYTFDQLAQELFDLWKKTDSLHQVIPDHCGQCQFGKMCPDIQSSNL
jgi:ATP-dependent helicase/nuclease subunit A